MESCPTDDEWLQFAMGQVAEPRAADLRAHLPGCESCTAAVAEAARAFASGGQAAVDSGPELQPGAKLGRYSVLERLGQGAVGAVYAAYDPQLDRRIAIKILRPDRRAGKGDAELQQRLLREAQAMARLRHPNVLTIYDAVSFEGGVFLAMDLVATGTLRAWLQKPRTPREILHVFSLAGAGLAAAHRAGIVHRDFKPDNVLVDDAGGVFVTDFGVARFQGEAHVSGEWSPSPPSITRSGAMVGTPAYMSPEQLRGEPADARSDIFGFCAALYEALYGEMPFPATDMLGLRTAIESGPARALTGKGIPRKVSRALLRGLQRDPAERFQTMDELLAALRLHPPRQAQAAAVLALLALIAFGVVFASRKAEEHKLEACRAGDGRLLHAFDADRQRAMKDAFMKSGAASAEAAFAGARDGLLAAVTAISQGRAAACAATLERGEASAALLDRRMQCLDERTQDADALAAAFTTANATTVEKAVLAVQQLGDPSACADRKRLLDAAPLPQDENARAKILEVREQVSQVAALHRAGNYREGLQRSADLAETARKTGYAPLEAEALYWRGRLLYDGNEQAKAPEVLLASAEAAARGHRDDLLVQAETQLVIALGWAQKTDEAVRWADHARAFVARLGDDPPMLADLLFARGYAHAKVFQVADALADDEQGLKLAEQRAGTEPARLVQALMAYAAVLGNASRYRDSVAADERALPLAEKTFGALHPTTIAIRSNLGISCSNSGQRRRALPILQRVLADRRAALGPDHLDVAHSSGALGTALGSLGDWERAAAAFSEAVAIAERKLGKDHPELIVNLALLAEPLGHLGRFDEAYAALDRSEALARKHQGEKSGMLGFIIEARGNVLEQQGRYADALHTFEQAAARIQAAVPGHSDVAACKSAEARQLRKLGKAGEALQAHQQILAEAEKAKPPDEKEIADRLVEVGDDLLALHRAAEARPYFERALPSLEPDESDPEEVAGVRFSAAEAFAGADRERALKLAHQADAALQIQPHASAALRDEVHRWVAANDARRDASSR